MQLLTDQEQSSSELPMPDQPDLASDLLRGARAIAEEIYGPSETEDESKKKARRLYHEQDRWPVFRPDDTGILYALKSRLRAHLHAMSIAREAEIAAAKTAVKPTTQPQRRRRRSRRQREAAANNAA